MAEAAAKRKAAWRTAALAALAFVGACKVVPKGVPPVAPPPPVVEQPRPIGPELPSDSERHRVALLAPMTGPNAGVGTSIANAATLAVLDTGGTHVRVTMYDTGTGAAAAAQKAIDEGNALILGPLLAEDVRAVAPVARAAHVPVVSFSNDVSVAGDGVFVMGYAPGQAIRRVVDYARGHGVANFAGLIPAGAYGQRSSTAFLRAVEGAGGKVTAMQNFDRSPGSITAAVNRLAAGSPYQAVLVADSGRIALAAAPAIRARAGAGARILGPELWMTESGLGASLALRGAWFASVSDTLYGQLAAKYRVRFGRSPYRLASLGYDAVLLVNKIGGDWRWGTAFPMARLTDPDGFSGIDGAFRFGRDGVAERALAVHSVGATGFTVLDPAPRGFGR